MLGWEANVEVKEQMGVRMKKLITLIIIIVYVPVLVSAKKYHITKAEIVATIQKNGLVHFEETRTYEFDGRFKWVSFELPRKGFDELQNVQIWEGETPFTFSESEEPGTFEISKKKGRYIIKWYIQAENETQTYTVKYDLSGALVSDNEWSEFYWIYLSRNWDKRNEQVKVQLQFEENIDTRYWVYSKNVLDEHYQKSINGWRYEAFTTSKRHEVKIQTHFPTKYLNKASAITEKINPIEEEENYQQYLMAQEEKAARSAIWEAWGWKFYIPVLALPFIVFFRLFNRNKPDFGELNAGKADLPSSIHPAVITYLMNYRSVSPNALKASLMKLVYDGFIEIHYEGREKKVFENRPLIKLSFTNKPPTELTNDFELELYSFLKERTDKYGFLDDVFKKQSTKVTQWYYEWTKKVKKVAQMQPWYVEESKADMYWNMVAQLLLVIPGIVMTVAVGPAGAFTIGVPLIFAAFSGTIYHRNETGEALYQQMDTAKKAFKNLRKNKKEVSEKVNWPLFIWALALGNSKEEVKWLIQKWPIDSMPNLHIAALDATHAIFILDDLLTVTHGAYMGSVGSAGATGAVGGAAGGGAGGGAG
jgi:uncharacterized membrane protein